MQKRTYTPRSLVFKPRIRTKRGYELATKYGFSLLNLRITDCHFRIKNATEQIMRLREKINKLMSQEHFNLFLNYATNKIDLIKTKVNRRHEEKLRSLRRQNSVSNTVTGTDYSGTYCAGTGITDISYTCTTSK